MLKIVLKRVINRLGYDLRRRNPATSETCQLMAMLSAHRVNLVLDVGANTGQFGQFLREAGYCGRIVSFEPLSMPWHALQKASRKDPKWEVAPRIAIGAEDDEIDINVSENYASSSVLNMLEYHAISAPESRYMGKERVSLRRLDSITLDYLRPDSVVFLKVDTQGYEDRVLLGAAGVFDRIVGLQFELSLVPLYEKQRLFDDMLADIKARGFDLWSIWPEFMNLNDGRLLQVNATFFRP